MRALRRFVAVTALALWTGSAAAHDFEGLHPDGPNAVKGQAGEIAAVDAEARTLRIGGNTYSVPTSLAVDLDAIRVGMYAVVQYQEQSGHLVATEVRLDAEPEGL